MRGTIIQQGKDHKSLIRYQKRNGDIDMVDIILPCHFGIVPGDELNFSYETIKGEPTIVGDLIKKL